MQVIGIVLAISITLALIVLLGGAGMMTGGYMMGPWMMGGYGMGFPFFGGVLMLVSWLLIIGGAVWLTRRAPAVGAASSESALEILRARYVRGEINQEQFEEMKKNIGA